MANLNSLFKYGNVVSVADEFDGGRIKVHVKGIDPNEYDLDEIPYAFPLLPKTIHIKPKIGESVFVFTQNGSFSEDRFWIGPIISQPHKLKRDTITSQSFLKSGIIKPDVAPSTNPNNVGVGVDDDDVALQGRGDTDVIVKPHEVRIRAGKTLDMRTLNKKNTGYVQVKYDIEKEESYVNVVGDYINILTHKGNDKFNLVDSSELINSEEYAKIIEKAHLLPFGDVLIEFMKLFISAFTSHVHGYHGLPPDAAQIEIKKLLSYKLDSMLSKHIRIN